MTPTANIERGVWADGVEIVKRTYQFFNIAEHGLGAETLAIYPTSKTFISSIQTEEEYKKAKKTSLDSLKHPTANAS